MGEAVIALVDGYASEGLALSLVVSNGIAHHERKLHAHDVQIFSSWWLEVELNSRDDVCFGTLAPTARYFRIRHD